MLVFSILSIFKNFSLPFQKHLISFERQCFKFALVYLILTRRRHIWKKEKFILQNETIEKEKMLVTSIFFFQQCFPPFQKHFPFFESHHFSLHFRLRPTREWSYEKKRTWGFTCIFDCFPNKPCFLRVCSKSLS